MGVGEGVGDVTGTDARDRTDDGTSAQWWYNRPSRDWPVADGRQIGWSRTRTQARHEAGDTNNDRLHLVVEGNSESRDTVDSHAKMESTAQRAEQAFGSPEEGGSCVQKDSGTAIGETVMPPGAYRLEAGGRA